jgi:energy-coupling factor transporter transmembrane protein EcfT
MKWSVHPAKYNQAKTILSLSFVLVFIVFVSVFYGIFWGMLGFIVLFVSLYSYYFPTSYEVNDEEVLIKTIFTTQRRKLKEFQRIYAGKNGILLSPFTHKTFLNQFRGVFLLLPAERDEIIDFLKKRIAVSEKSDDAQEHD